MNQTPSFSRTCSIPVDPNLGFRRVVIELSAPSLPFESGDVSFAEHVLGEAGQPTDTVIACTRSGVVITENLGESWEYVPMPEMQGIELWNSFTTDEGMHLLQGRSAATAGIARTVDDFDAPIALVNRSWEFVDRVAPGVASWHGSRSIDEADGVIIYGEYPANSYRRGADGKGPKPEHLELLHDSQLFRSVDGGRTWESVLRVDWRTVRHFHTVVADPWQAGRWWASSGDRPDECRVWQSLDHGLSWSEISCVFQTDDLPPSLESIPRGVLRHTDLIVREDDLIWGADDLLGLTWAGDEDAPMRRRVGSRMFRSRKSLPWQPVCVGYVGSPVRSLIDVGPAYLVMTEAKTRQLGYCPQILLLSKSEPFRLTPLLTVDNFSTGPATGFTHSRASRVAKDGVFFTYRARTDAFPDGACVMRWRVAFD